MITQNYSLGIAGRTPAGGNRASEATAAMINIFNDTVKEYTSVVDVAELVESNDDDGSFAVRVVPTSYPLVGVTLSKGITELMLNSVVSMVKSGSPYPASKFIVEANVKVMIYDRFDERAQREVG